MLAMIPCANSAQELREKRGKSYSHIFLLIESKFCPNWVLAFQGRKCCSHKPWGSLITHTGLAPGRGFSAAAVGCLWERWREKEAMPSVGESQKEPVLNRSSATLSTTLLARQQTCAPEPQWAPRSASNTECKSRAVFPHKISMVICKH